MGDMKLTDYLVRNNGIWEGSLANFVNRDGVLSSMAVSFSK